MKFYIWWLMRFQSCMCFTCTCHDCISSQLARLSSRTGLERGQVVGSFKRDVPWQVSPQMNWKRPRHLSDSKRLKGKFLGLLTLLKWFSVAMTGYVAILLHFEVFRMFQGHCDSNYMFAAVTFGLVHPIWHDYPNCYIILRWTVEPTMQGIL